MAFTWFGRVLGSLFRGQAEEVQAQPAAMEEPSGKQQLQQERSAGSQEAVLAGSRDGETQDTDRSGVADAESDAERGGKRKMPWRAQGRARLVVHEARSVRRKLAWARDVALWNSLPMEMVESEILPRLEPASLFKLRAVCRRWDSLLWEVYEREHCRARFFLDFGPKAGGALHDPLRDQWQRLPLQWVQERVKNARDVAQVRAAGGGFLFYWSAASDRGSRGTPPNCLSVCRPAGMEWRDLPMPSNLDRCRYDVVKLVPDGEEGYQVVLAKVDGRNTEVYDSKTMAWRMASPLPKTTVEGHDLQGYGWQRSTGPCCNGFLYCMFWCRLQGERPRGAAFGALRGGLGLFSYMVMAFDIEGGVWSEVLIPDKVGAGLILPFLMECSGRVLMAGLYKSRRAGGNHTECRDKLRIWRLHVAGPRVESWEEEGLMPEPIFQEMFTNGRSRHGQFRLMLPWMIHCVGVNHFVYIFSWRKNKIAIYDLTKKSWRRFPEWPLSAQYRAASEVTYSFAPGLIES